jgi:hypothetical protein
MGFKVNVVYDEFERRSWKLKDKFYPDSCQLQWIGELMSHERAIFIFEIDVNEIIFFPYLIQGLICPIGC